MTYSLHYRKKVLKTWEKEGLTIEETARLFNIGVASIVRWLKNPKPKSVFIRPWRKIDMVALARDVREYPDACLHERAQRLNVSRNGVFEALRRMSVTYKKTKKPSARG